MGVVHVHGGVVRLRGLEQLRQCRVVAGTMERTRLFQQREVVNYSLNGNKLHIHMQFAVMPGHEADWSRVLVSRVDITARKGPWPVSVLVIDLNGLKEVNDTAGHAAGDALLASIGRKLLARARASDAVARLGGDEFAVIVESLRDDDQEHARYLREASEHCQRAATGQ